MEKEQCRSSGGKRDIFMDLVIMAAGIGSRFGKGIKQLTPVGPCGEVIMEYSIYDALEAGFDRVVFITRHDLLDTFKEIIGDKMEKVCPTAYAFQELTDLPEGFSLPEGRTKPWGTGQAVLACKGIVKGPFAVINADDYYGKECFKQVHDYLASHSGEGEYCMAGFILGNTLSDNGAVTRGVCKVGEDGCLTGVDETSGIVKTASGAAVEKDGVQTPIDAGSHVSMNMWGLTPEFIGRLEAGFKGFLGGLKEGDVKSEYLLPTVIDGMIQSGEASVKVLETHDKWFGVTYAEDKDVVVNALRALHESGGYPTPLFNR